MALQAPLRGTRLQLFLQLRHEELRAFICLGLWFDAARIDVAVGATADV